MTRPNFIFYLYKKLKILFVWPNDHINKKFKNKTGKMKLLF